MTALTSSARERVVSILSAGVDLTLATLRPDGYPQATTVSYVNEGLLLYAGVGLDSQKAHNVQHDPRVSLTVTLPYTDWDHIRGISAAALASVLSGGDELARVSAAFMRKMPQLKAMVPGDSPVPWGGIVILRIAPHTISLLDYRLGFGHTELYDVAPGQLQP